MEEPSFNQIMLMMTNQQMTEMRERAADREEEREERRLRLEEQREERRMQFQLQQQMMTTMFMMISGRNPVFPSSSMPQTTLYVPTVRDVQGGGDQNEGNDDGNQDGAE
jgi:hypothetical protein